MRYALPILLCVVALGVCPVNAQELQVLVLAGNISQAEFPKLEEFEEIGGFAFSYEQTSDRTLPGLSSADILWIGQGEMCENNYFLPPETEEAILDFVEGGGVAIIIGQDSDDNRPCETGWLPVPMTGVERGGTEIFAIADVPNVGDLFTRPNDVQQIHHDDTWTDPDPSIILLSTINNAQDIGIGLLRHGQGYYLITGLENENAADVTVNTPIMENLLLYAAELSQSAAVSVHGKHALLWSTLKTR